MTTWTLSQVDDFKGRAVRYAVCGVILRWWWRGPHSTFYPWWKWYVFSMHGVNPFGLCPIFIPALEFFTGWTRPWRGPKVPLCLYQTLAKNRIFSHMKKNGLS